MNWLKISISCYLFFCCLGLAAQESEKVFLSGTGSDDTRSWKFFCTGGMNAGKWSKIEVPSCWELQGFGKYDYGFAKDSVKGKEKGIYQHEFMVPSTWKGKKIDLVFEGVMTDAVVKINGKSAGAVHQGAFYAFQYNISALVKYGNMNALEVEVSKHSENSSVNAAERKGDYWIFGGIFRPVYLKLSPDLHISHVAVDAKADGNLKARVQTSPNTSVSVELFDQKNASLGKVNKVDVDAAGNADLRHHFNGVLPWNPEYPTLYTALFSLIKDGKVHHQVKKKIGFRTVEVRQRDGIYINGQKIKFKGVNRHSFRPESGRTTSKLISIEDVRMMKSMNMNAVRMSHYPPDDHFLDACDSMGLFVLDELAGWHGAYDTPVGSKLLKEMIDHDVNHPSIVLWVNGNEGGHNFELDPLFAQHDIQQRTVIHAWQLFNGIETQHYREFGYGIGNYDKGREIVMPTEFLHGQFDGGHGAGLEDYWEYMWNEPLQAGGFLWDYADQAVVRKDRQDSLDTDKHRAADGILGPHLEKEGSFFAIKEIWSPIKIKRREIVKGFDGRFEIENRYHFTNLKSCQYKWSLKYLGKDYQEDKRGEMAYFPDVHPGQKGYLQLQLPANWNEYDALYITAIDPQGNELFTWSYPIVSPSSMVKRMVKTSGIAKINVAETAEVWNVKVKDLVFDINRQTGLINNIQNALGKIPFGNGPVLEEGVNNFGNFTLVKTDSVFEIKSTFNRKNNFNTMQWSIYPSGWVRLQIDYFPSAYFTNFSGINFSMPESSMRAVNYTGYGPYRVWKNRMKGNSFGDWHKVYNTTETGEAPWNYPEFKGYHAGFYHGIVSTSSNRFTVATENEDMFLRLFTPAWKTDQWHNYEPLFPAGDISFMRGISSIGSKTQRNETTGPMGSKNIFYDYEKEPGRSINITLYFNFSHAQ